MLNKRYFPTRIMNIVKKVQYLLGITTLQEQSQYDGDIKAIKKVHHIQQFERQEELSIVQLL